MASASELATETTTEIHPQPTQSGLNDGYDKRTIRRIKYLYWSGGWKGAMTLENIDEVSKSGLVMTNECSYDPTEEDIALFKRFEKHESGEEHWDLLGTSSPNYPVITAETYSHLMDMYTAESDDSDDESPAPATATATATSSSAAPAYAPAPAPVSKSSTSVKYHYSHLPSVDFADGEEAMTYMLAEPNTDACYYKLMHHLPPRVINGKSSYPRTMREIKGDKATIVEYLATHNDVDYGTIHIGTI